MKTQEKPPPVKGRRHMKPQDVADQMDVPVSRVWGWIKKGWLEAVELPRGMYRITPEALERFLTDRPWEA